MVQVNILTNDKHLWLLKGFSYCFNLHCPKQVVNIWGFGYPDFALPENFQFHSLAENNYPAQRWSTALIEMCNQCDDYFLFMLEDYWLIDKVDLAGVNLMFGFIKQDPKALRIDLSGNRAAYVQSQYYDSVNGYDIVETPMRTPYQMSFQAAIWNRELLLSVLKEDETPWEAEINGSARLRNKANIKVLGAKDTLLKYQPVYRTREYKMQLNKIPKKQLKQLDKVGYLQNDKYC